MTACEVFQQRLVFGMRVLVLDCVEVPKSLARLSVGLIARLILFQCAPLGELGRGCCPIFIDDLVHFFFQLLFLAQVLISFFANPGDFANIFLTPLSFEASLHILDTLLPKFP